MRRPLGIVVLVLAAAAALGAGPSKDPLAVGKELFLRTWVPWDPRAAPGGDGLGPMYNASSCVACHSQGGIGGGGPRDRNVMLISTKGDGTFFVQHKNTTLATSVPMPPGVKARGERNTPALYGVGVLDAITDDQIRAQAAIAQPHVSGRVATDANGNIGRFGWKGHTARLYDFVATACANELGLEVDGHPEGDPQGALAQTQSVVETALKANHIGSIPGSGADMTIPEVASLTDFVRSLPKPGELFHQPGREAGHKTFQSIGCAECHVEKLGEVTGVYSDLLLHDMAPGKSDGASAYGVASKKIVSETSKDADLLADEAAKAKKDAAPRNVEWRTPPLWGVRDSAPYLHDGSAASLDDAIRAHGGEADFAMKAYNELAQPDRLQVVAFLESLVAPGTAP